MKGQSLQSPTNREFRKREARHTILTLIHAQGAISQTGIAAKTKIRPGTIQMLVNELIDDRLVRKTGEGKSRGGRRPTLLEVDPDHHFAIGLFAEEKKITGGLVNLKGTIVNFKELKNLNHKSQDEFVESIAEIVHEILCDFPGKEDLLGIGIGIPGLVDRKNGIGIRCNYYDWWKNIPVRSLLQDKIGATFYIENDTRTAAIGEKWYGKGKGIKNFLYISLGETVGMAIVINGDLYYGFGESAGELGHTIIQIDGDRCTCGNRGCAEAMASGTALKRKAGVLYREGVQSLIFDDIKQNKEITLDKIIDAVILNDKVAYNLISETGENIGIAVGNMVNILNPELIILDGSLMRAKDVLTESIVKSIKTHCFPKPAAEAKVLPSELGARSGILGASSLVTRQLFEMR